MTGGWNWFRFGGWGREQKEVLGKGGLISEGVGVTTGKEKCSGRQLLV